MVERSPNLGAVIQSCHYEEIQAIFLYSLSALP